ncbi:MAG: creatininase family protein [Gemmatimonadaceae bacterium]|jgi:hypothetical protein|nr:creatininase family protein [Gemmatimonadaceae bacterium]
MEFDSAPLRLAELSHDTVVARLARDPRLLVPVGGMGRERALPLGWRSLLVNRMADDCSAAMGWLRAPTLAYGTSDGDALARTPLSTRRRTLHRFVNDLLANAETLGVREVLLLTARADEAQLDALATIHVRRAQLRVIDILPPRACGTTDADDAAALAAIVERLAQPVVSPTLPSDVPAYGVLRRRVLAALDAHRRATDRLVRHA